MDIPGQNIKGYSAAGFPQKEAGLYTILLIKMYFDADFRMVLLVGT